MFAKAEIEATLPVLSGEAPFSRDPGQSTMILYSVGELGSTLEDESSVAPSPATSQNSAFGALLWARPKTVMKEVRSVQALGPA